MGNKLIARLTRQLKAPVDKVWEALTTPDQIRQYLFGTDTKSDFKKGSTITYSGVYEGKAYEDKGVVIDAQPNKLLHTTHYSPLSGKEDKPENYAHVIYELEDDGDTTTIHLSQDNIENEEQMEHMKKNWSMVLDGLQKLVEQG
jgi:uncharacterized protein YndB with AHSA1/START domain